MKGSRSFPLPRNLCSWLRAVTVRRPIDWFSSFTRSRIYPLKERDAVALAFREMLMNAIEHGAHFNATQHVSISYIRAKHMVLCRVKDPGEGFSLQEARHAAITNPPSDPIRHTAIREKQGLRPGGFGILLTKHIIDELIYSETGNEVVLIKYLKPEQLETS